MKERFLPTFPRISKIPVFKEVSEGRLVSENAFRYPQNLPFQDSLLNSRSWADLFRWEAGTAVICKYVLYKYVNIVFLDLLSLVG